MKRSFFQAAVVSILLYGCTTWTQTKWLEKKLDGNYTRMLRATLNKSWRQHPTRHQLYGHLPPIMKTIQVRQTRHTGHCWRSRDKLISDVILWTHTYGRAKARQSAQTYIQQLCEDTGCSPEDLPEAMNDREKWWERVKDIRTSGTTWWWWWMMKIVNSDDTVNHIISRCSKIAQKEAWLGRKGYPLRIVQDFKFWPYWQIVYAQNSIQTNQQILARRWHTLLIKKKRTYYLELTIINFRRKLMFHT